MSFSKPTFVFMRSRERSNDRGFDQWLCSIWHGPPWVTLCEEDVMTRHIFWTKNLNTLVSDVILLS